MSIYSMSSAQIREPASFGKRHEPHTVIVSRNGKTRQFTIRPVFFSIAVCSAIMLMVGYFSATAYLVFRDDLISASFANQARIKHEYEDRIAALRTKLDRVTSRQLLDQQAIESRVHELMARQENIGKRSGRMSNLLDKAKNRGLNAKASTGSIPVPTLNPVKTGTDNITTGSIDPTAQSGVQIASSFQLRGNPSQSASPSAANPYSPQLSSNFTQQLFGEVAEQIGMIDTKQRQEVDQLRIAAADKVAKISSILKSNGVKVPQMPSTDVGGPFVPLDHSMPFEAHLEALESTLNHYDSLSGIARKMPFANPIPGAKISSNFGYRKDPFNGRSAMHSGMDFKAPTGTPVRATGDGVIVRAGRKGGYGKTVEIRHKNGLITRYAHLSRINVKKGHKVNVGQVIGKVGSTGRSTGPHLHYEVRQGKTARNPSKYIRVGFKLRGLL
jgi:murein DD-endopeptidase MepM/ murein hydrolase activator NlpD